MNSLREPAIITALFIAILSMAVPALSKPQLEPLPNQSALINLLSPKFTRVFGQVSLFPVQPIGGTSPIHLEPPPQHFWVVTGPKSGYEIKAGGAIIRSFETSKVEIDWQKRTIIVHEGVCLVRTESGEPPLTLLANPYSISHTLGTVQIYQDSTRQISGFKIN